MAQHINYQHIRQQPKQHIRQPTGYEKLNILMNRIRSSPKQMIGWILFIIFILVVVVAGGHYMRYWTLPLSFVPQKALAPASHLQYFFF